MVIPIITMFIQSPTISNRDYKIQVDAYTEEPKLILKTRTKLNNQKSTQSSYD